MKNRIPTKKRRLVTAALPYVNNVPHLGNLIQVLSADVFARFCRQYGFETLYICGTDEYGTATETKALEQGVGPKELCDKFHAIHKDIYQWFSIDFDYFGRTSEPKHTEIVQEMYKQIEHNAYIEPQEFEQLYCSSCERFLADRFVKGECPHCHYTDAKGDQCDNCGKLLEPQELISPQCSVCQSEPQMKKTTHLVLDLETGSLALESWMEETAKQGFWTKNALQVTRSWIRDGLQNKVITRDLKWGVPVPRKGFEDKVFYVWFDAPIGYVSLTASYTDDWQRWWKNCQDVELYQFIGKDNIPFHTVLFPYTQLATGASWTMLHHMSSSEYLNYETGKFSKSNGVGIFGNDCQETGIPADVWRFYLCYNRPESTDYQFTWQDFQDRTNQELIGNIGNLFNRNLTFIQRHFDNKIPCRDTNAPLSQFYLEVQTQIRHITNDLNHARLKKAFRAILDLGHKGNQAFQHAEPWRLCKEDPELAKPILTDLSYLLRDLAILLKPFLPTTATKMMSILGIKNDTWSQLGEQENDLGEIGELSLLFNKLEDETIEKLKSQYSGNQSATLSPTQHAFTKQVLLKVGVIVEAQQHPEAEKLLVFKIDVGEAELRTVVSGLVGHYTPEEMLHKHIILVANLKPVKLRNIVSNGMVLTVENNDGQLEVLQAPDTLAGKVVRLQGTTGIKPNGKIIKIDVFSPFELKVEDHNAKLEDLVLEVDGVPITTQNIADGNIS